MQPDESPRLAIFDLGGVVFRAGFDPAFEEWARLSGATIDDIRRKFSYGAHFEAFERGTISAVEFHSALCHELGLELTFDQFVAGWNIIYGDIFEEVSLSLQQLKGKVKVVAFTNTNEVHCLIWPVRYREVLEHFDHIYISSELGVRKPEAEGFAHILHDCGVAAHEAVFFDDFLPNVEAARLLGLRAYLVKGPETIVQALQELQFIASE